MAVITFPSTLFVKSLVWERYDQDVTFRGPFGVQSVSQIAPLWKVGISFDLTNEENAGAYQALILKLDGVKNQLALWNVGRPVPRGTFTGATGTTTMTGNIAAGAGVLTFTNASYPNKTLLPGDYVGIINGSDTLTQQVVMVTDSSASDGTGLISVAVKPAVRYAIGTGSVVTLQQPKALFRQQEGSGGWAYERTIVQGMTLDLLEDVRP